MKFRNQYLRISMICLTLLTFCFVIYYQVRHERVVSTFKRLVYVKEPAGHTFISATSDDRLRLDSTEYNNQQDDLDKYDVTVKEDSLTSNESDSINMNSKKKYLIYLCDKRRSCGGWADRQKGMMAAYIVALVTGRTFGINMSFPCDLKLFYIPNDVNWYIKVSELHNLTWEIVDWMDNRHRSVDCESDFNKKHPSDVVFLRSNQDVTYRLSKSPRYGHLVPKEFRNKRTAWGRIWRKLMKLSFHMEEKVDKFMSRIPPVGDLVCGHVRMRRSSTLPSDSPALASMKSLESMWNLLAQYEQNASRIFIATDSTEVRDIARRRFKDKELDSNGLVMHIDRQGKTEDACEALEMALLEQAVLTRCKVLVLSPSGFGIRAAMMSTLKQNLLMFKNGTIKKFTP